MRDQRKTKAQLVGELHEARRRIAELEDSVGLLDLSEAPGGPGAAAAHVELGRQLDVGFRRLVEQLPAISYTAALDEHPLHQPPGR
ncbi:MAG: hypothetical protein QGH74_04935, partial [Candidatus Brocadiia bacterium]|nr:hypothetical protein [Candidatus Brocadiia bacterium]